MYTRRNKDLGFFENVSILLAMILVAAIVAVPFTLFYVWLYDSGGSWRLWLGIVIAGMIKAVFQMAKDGK